MTLLTRKLVWGERGSLRLVTFLLISGVAQGQVEWQARVGSQVPDCAAGAAGDTKLAEACQARQAMAFVPNEIWIHQNDSITWTHATDEGHTVRRRDIHEQFGLRPVGRFRFAVCQ